MAWKFWLIEDKTVPLIIYVKNGFYTEDPDPLICMSNMFFKANRDLPYQEAFLNRKNELVPGTELHPTKGLPAFLRTTKSFLSKDLNS
jgi:hypothetical protein